MATLEDGFAVLLEQANNAWNGSPPEGFIQLLRTAYYAGATQFGAIITEATMKLGETMQSLASEINSVAGASNLDVRKFHFPSDGGAN